MRLKGETWLILAALAGGGYLLYRVLNKANEAKEQIAESIAKLWLKMFPMPPSMELLGNVKFPGNILVPIQQLNNAKAIRQDKSGNVFVNYSGLYWKLSPQVNGNWPATRVE